LKCPILSFKGNITILFDSSYYNLCSIETILTLTHGRIMSKNIVSRDTSKQNIFVSHHPHMLPKIRPKYRIILGTKPLLIVLFGCLKLLFPQQQNPSCFICSSTTHTEQTEFKSSRQCSLLQSGLKLETTFVIHPATLFRFVLSLRS
jgi:hypothetical protein